MESKAKKKPKKYTYNVTASFNFKGNPQNYMTQLYQLGVYIIWNFNSALQSGVTPDQMVRLKKKLQKDFEAGEITDLEFGREITVTTDEHGFYKEIG